MTDPSEPLAGLDAGHEDVLHRALLLAVATAAEDVTRCGRALDELVPRLAALRDAAVPSLRTQAMRLMGRLMRQGHESAQACFNTWLEDRTRREETLQALEDVLDTSAPAALRDTLLLQLDAESPKERIALIRLLAVLVDDDERVREALLARTQDKNLEVSAAAVQALASVVDQDARVRQAFLSRFIQRGTAPARKHPPGSVRASLTAALGHVLSRHAEVREAFLAQFAHEPPQPEVVAWLGTLAARDGEVREALLTRLAQGSAEARPEVIKALASLAIQDQQVRDALLARLDDERHDVVSAVLKALGAGAVRDPRVRDALLARLDDKSSFIRGTAIDALGSEVVGDARVRDAFLARLDAGAKGFHLSVVHALGALVGRDERVRQALLRRFPLEQEPVQREFLRALGGAVGLHEEIRDLFLSRLDDTSFFFHDTLRALTPLVSHDDKVRHALQARLAGVDPSLRWRSLVLLGPWAGHDEPVRERLLALLDDKSEHARETAAWVLTAFVQSHAQVRHALLARLRRTVGPSARGVLIQALAPAAGSDRAVRYALLALRKDRAPQIARAAAHVLRDVVPHDAKVRHTFLKELQLEDDSRTAAAVIALSGVAEQDEEVRRALLVRLAQPRFSELQKVFSSLSLRSGPPGRMSHAHALVPRLEERGVLLGMASPLVLGPLASSHEETRQALLTQLADARGDVRTRAVEALSPVVGRHAEVREALLARLDDALPAVRRSAARALSPLVGHDEDVRHALLVRFQGPERHETLVAALRPAAGLDPEVRATLLAALDDENRAVRLKAVEVLGDCVDGHSEVRHGLLTRLEDADWAMRATVVKTLVEHAPALLDTERVLLPWLGATRGASGRTSESGEDTSPMLAHDVRQAVARRVAHLAQQDEALIERLAEMLRHPAWRIREGAAMALLFMPGGPPPRVQTALRALPDDLRDEDNWRDSLVAIEVLLNHRDGSTSQLAVHRAMQALDHGTQPWHDSVAMGHVRAEAARLLGRLEPTHRDEPLLQRLIQLLREDPREDTREAAYQAVSRLIAVKENGG